MKKFTLGDIAYISSGGTPSREHSEYFGGNIPWAKISDIENSKDGILIDTEEKITEDGLSNIRNKIFKKGTLLFAMYGSIGKVAIAGVDTAANQAILGIYPKNVKELFLKYLIFWFKENKSKMVNQGRGGILQNLSATIVRNQKVELPVYEVQIKIAQVLTQAEKLIAQRKESIALLDEYLKSTFLEMFYANSETKIWNEVRFEELAKDKKSSMRSGPFGSSLLHGEFTETGDVKVLGIDNVVTNRFTWKKSRYITNEKFKELKRYRVYPSDVLISIMATLGRTAVVPKDIPICINSKHLAAITLNQEIANPYFIAYAFHSHPDIVSQLIIHRKGAIMDGLNLTIIKGIKLKRPPIELQNKFGDAFEKTEALKSRYEHSLRELEQLFGSLSQRAFKGELDLSRMEVSKDAYKISDTPPSPTPPHPPQKKRPQVAVKADTETSIWLSNRKKGKTGKVPFTAVEGNAVLRTEFAKRGKGFHFQAFEAFLKQEGFVYAFEQVKDFLFEKLEQKELLQYYSNVEWMEERYRQEIDSDEDDFSSDGRIWLVVNNKVVP